MSSEEKIKRSGFTFSVFRLRDDGPWYAGAEASKGSTRSEAIAAHLKHARADRRAADKRNAADRVKSDARANARKGRTCDLSTCSGALNTPAHRTTAKHRNAVIWDRHKRYGL